jgi:DNA-binding LytR/AlgR family response regulator
MISIASVEDERDTADKIASYLTRYAETIQTEIRTIWYKDSESFLAEEVAFDMVFMDIELPGMNGYLAARELRKKNKDIVLIFVTNLAQYAVNGYEVSAFDFVVKPFSYQKFSLKLVRAFEHFRKVSKKKLIISSRESKKVIYIDELKYVEVLKHELTYHTLTEQYVTSGTLKKVKESLDDCPFALCNSCYLVNLRYVKEIKGNKVLVADEELQMSVPKRKDFMKALTHYLGVGGGI